MPFDNTYARLPEDFFQRITPVPVAAPSLIRLNRELAESLGLDLPDDDTKLAEIFSGNALLEGSEPIAQAYAGHQFGGFVPQLGDGRAILLGEVVDAQGRRFDIQLKGSGQTRFSRSGDGRSPLGPVIREYVLSEAMHALGIPSSRGLAMTATGETVRRETPLPGGVFTRVAASHIRVGTFEYFASRQQETHLRTLADYAIDRHYPEAREAANPYAALFDAVCRAQARLVARWLCVGFIHGVMNTDNTTISGETIDYGPCAFLDRYNPAKVYSSIDMQGRYAYDNQPNIARWNLSSLGGCLIPLLDENRERAHAVGEEILESFGPVFTEAYHSGMCRKIGLTGADGDFALAGELLSLMARDRADFTLTFRLLGDRENPARFEGLFASSGEITAWREKWEDRLEQQGRAPDTVAEAMRTANPAFIPRNHRVAEAIAAAERADYGPLNRLMEVLAEPYADQPEDAEYMDPPAPDEEVRQTFCGT
ncbi:YdiU family protein [Pseudodesulfovibrio cashew]|uniref:Protein nucleotidyltransferase YdiU n=1 Tax=Pseudodesulfovibrio cashew TaxID=2678688 RepID=A0A6I6JDH4_9BACT|nr:YdiU family protein [Pseudodesulfovibrio cashew]QGY39120.1 YdiU family protein [Pseudodesulfovibrio cashew]